MSAGQPRLEVLFACFEDRKRAARVHRPLSKQIKTDGAEILDEVVLTSPAPSPTPPTSPLA